MSEQNTQGQVEEATIETIDPFADDDTEPTAYVKLDDRRAEAVAKARELLADDADSATAEEGILALRKDGDAFYVTMKGSPRQVRKFGRDFRNAQPKAAGTSSRISKANDLTDQLAEARNALSIARKATETDEVRTQLEAVKTLADAMIAKIEDADES